MTGRMWICGLSMEMELAEEMGTVGKCKGCLYYEIYPNGALHCRIKGIIDDEMEDCRDWVVDHR